MTLRKFIDRFFGLPKPPSGNYEFVIVNPETGYRHCGSMGDTRGIDPDVLDYFVLSWGMENRHTFWISVSKEGWRE